MKIRFSELLQQKYGNNIPSQDALAEMIGISQTTISRWRKGDIGRFDDAVVVKVCQFFDVGVEELMYIEDNDQ